MSLIIPNLFLSNVKKYEFKVEEDYEILIDIDVDCHNDYISLDKQNLIINKGYVWDGSSIPYKRLLRIMSLGIYNADRFCKKASLVHDALCQLMREGLLSKEYKEYADKVYRNMCIIGGLKSKRADIRYKALRKYGDKYIEKEKNPRNRIYEV